MSIKTLSVTFSPVQGKLLLVLLMCFFAVAGCFSVCYLVTDYDKLVTWYLSQGDCFYKQEEWTTQFFTPAVKRAGNLFSLLAIIIGLAGIAVVVRKWKTLKTSVHTFRINMLRLPWYVAIAALAVGSAVWVWNFMLPSNDEVFSVVKCTETGPLRILAYYMLPNNHVYFNLVNNVLFGWMGDFVQSGRLLSVLAYVSVLLCVFRLLARFIENVVFAFVALVPVALQVHTWGFAAQARGYELQLLCGWIAVSAILELSQKSKAEDANGVLNCLALNTVVNIAGFLLIPSYLYLYFAQLLFMALQIGYSRNIWKPYAVHQIVLGAVVFLCYLPGLCFSGIGAFTSNGWVVPGTETLGQYLPHITSLTKTFISDCFSGIGSNEGFINYVVFFAPLLLLFSKRKEHRRVVLFYFILWASFVFYSLIIKRPPFHRTLIIHFSITMACCVYTLYTVTGLLAARIRNTRVRIATYSLLFAAPVLIYSGWMFTFNKQNVTWLLYGYDVNSTHSAQIMGLKQIPAGTSVSFSEDAFYYFYSWRKQGYKANRCQDADAQYYIKIRSKPFPGNIGTRYDFMADAGDDYAIYKRK